MRAYIFIIPALISYIAKADTDWKVVVSNNDYVMRCVDFVDHTTAVAVGDNGVIVKSTDGGKTWNEKSKGVFGDIKLVAVYDEDVLAACGTGFILHTTDDGENWKQVFTGTDEEFRFLKFMTNELAEMPGRVVAAGDDALLMLSNSNGARWFKQDVSAIIGEKDILYCPTNYFDDFKDTVANILVSEGIQYHTRNNFKSVYGKIRTIFTDGDVDIIHTFTGFERGTSASQGAGFGQKTNGRGTFLELQGGGIRGDHSRGHVRFNGGFYQSLINHSYGVYRVAVGEGGIISEITGPDFNRNANDRTDITNKDLYWCDRGIDPESDDNVAVVAVGDGVILHREFGEHPSSIGVREATEAVPFTLFPNPTSQQSTLSFHLTKSETVHYTVFSVSGVLMEQQTLLNQPVGDYQIPLTALKEKGLYLVRLQVGESVSTKSLVKY